MAQGIRQPQQPMQAAGQSPQPSILTGRPLTQEEAEALVEEMEARAEAMPETEFSPELGFPVRGGRHGGYPFGQSENGRQPI